MHEDVRRLGRIRLPYSPAIPAHFAAEEMQEHFSVKVVDYVQCCSECDVWMLVSFVEKFGHGNAHWNCVPVEATDLDREAADLIERTRLAMSFDALLNIMTRLVDELDRRSQEKS